MNSINPSIWRRLNQYKKAEAQKNLKILNPFRQIRNAQQQNRKQ